MFRTALALSLFAAGAAPLAAQCPAPDVVVPPFNIPVSAGGWQIQHFGQPLVAGQIDYVVISLPAPVPAPLAALPWLFCNPVGNTPCLYIELNVVSWFNIGPAPGQNVTLGVTWPNNPSLAGILFVCQTGIAGCAGGNDLSILITGRLQ